jgi:ketosteroid isomerase-like protein
MGKSLVILTLLLTAVAPAFSQQTPTLPALPSVALPPEFDRVLRDYERAWRARDAAALAALFAEDGFVMSNGRPPVRGREAIRAAYANAGGPLSLRALAWATEGKVGYIIGGFGGEAGSPDSGKFILALKRDGDGRWLIAADMDNSNRRTRVAPTPTPTPLPK